MLKLKKFKLDTTLSKDKKIELIFDEATKTSYEILTNHFNNNKLKYYIYDSSIAVEELGLSQELIYQLVDDYISQILNTMYQFNKLINSIKELHGEDKEINIIELKSLAHKNLGVVKNLRIEDAELLLNDLMTKDDIEHLAICVKGLESCAFKLNPEYAFDVLELIELKSSCYGAL